MLIINGYYTKGKRLQSLGSLFVKGIYGIFSEDLHAKKVQSYG